VNGSPHSAGLSRHALPLGANRTRPSAWPYWLRCIILAGVCAAGAYYLLGDQLTEPCRFWLADACAAVSSALGENAVSEGNVLVTAGGRMRLNLTRECAGIYSLAVIIALMWSVRRPTLSRLLWLVPVLIVWIISLVVRISSIAVLSEGSISQFHFMHDGVWPFLSGLLLAILYGVCWRWDSGSGNGRVSLDPLSLQPTP
jgi:exosortase/archaeosortase family protein